jgi:hypothetical protein
MLHFVVSSLFHFLSANLFYIQGHEHIIDWILAQGIRPSYEERLAALTVSIKAKLTFGKPDHRTQPVYSKGTFVGNIIISEIFFTKNFHFL